MNLTAPFRRIDSGRGHRYVDAYGIKVPGVTTLLSGGLPKPALTNWAARTAAEFAVDNWETGDTCECDDPDHHPCKCGRVPEQCDECGGAA